MIKHRLSASVDATLLEVAEAAVAAGRAPNISAWVNEGLHRQAAHDRRMLALDEFLSAYESAHGEITELEIAAASRRASERALVVRGQRRVAKERPRQRRARAR